MRTSGIGVGNMNSANEPRESGESASLDHAIGEFSSSRRGQDRVASPRAALRWWLAVAFGIAWALPLGLLLSYAASLLFFLGLFFFVLFGLLIGAFVFRIASRIRPISRISVVSGTALIVSVGWATSIIKEAIDFPVDMAKQVIADRTLQLGGLSASEYAGRVTEDVGKYLRDAHAPGGVLGYVRWIVTSGALPAEAVPSLPRDMRRSPGRVLWLVRELLALACLGFGVASQTLPLIRPGTIPQTSPRG